MATHSREEIVAMFDEFRSELDESRDRTERIIKVSRELTIQSKRAISLAHRLATEGSINSSSSQKAAMTVQELLRRVKGTLLQVYVDIPTEYEFWQYQRFICPGLEEYTEAVSYAHYLSTGELISQVQVQTWIMKDENQVLPLPEAQYLLGVSDLTGELMRLAITTLAKGKGRARGEEISDFVRRCKADFERFTPFVRELSKKQQVTKQSVQKIEEANYAVKLRSAEFGSDVGMLDQLVQRSLVLRDRADVGMQTLDNKEEH